jgi:AcrR family transcriptional regulator
MQVNPPEINLVQCNIAAGNAPSRIEIRRGKVADAARILFAEHGFHATGIAQIASASGIRVQQIYRDFVNKEAIVAVIVEQDVGAWFGEIAAVATRTGGGRAELRGWVKMMLLDVLTQDDPPLFLEIFAEASRNPRIATILQAIDSHARSALVEVFAAFGAKDADPAHLWVMADLFLSFVGGLNGRRVIHPALDAERLSEMMAAMVVDQIAG